MFEEVICIVLCVFEDGLYYVFVDDEQVEMFDEIVVLQFDSILLLLCLIVLVGG